MNEVLSDAIGYLKEKGRGLLVRLWAQMPFFVLVMAIAITAVWWGLHETHLLLVRSGLEEAWEEGAAGRFSNVSLSDAADLGGRTLWALLRALLLPALAIVVSLLAGLMRLAGAVLPQLAPRVRKASWAALGMAAVFLLADVLF
ncbi:MAG: hypothetical protein ACYC5Y_04295 [Symbiobacteriia bacterium]